MSKKELLEKVALFYLNSGDFNGIPAATLVAQTEIEWSKLCDTMRELIEAGLVGVLFSDLELNTHVLRTGFPPKEVQISKLITRELHHTCIYPRPKFLEGFVDRSRYAGEPYTLCLALGEPQLAFRVFDLSILEFYRNDPRYWYRNDDLTGLISIHDEYYQTGQMPERDEILLETFGFAYDQDLHRAVAVFLRYLADLTPEHQQIWKAKEISGSYKLHPDYYRISIEGNWGRRVQIFVAFQKELYLINQMSKAMGRPLLFRRDFGEDGANKPQKLSFLVRPTLEEFNDFVLLLDKLLSDNLNKDFFGTDVPLETEFERVDGKIQVQSKGTLQILDEWVRNSYNTSDWKPWDESIKTLKEVRKLRQKPAHAVDENVFDQRYFKEQRELIIKVYTAVRTLRQMLADHPSVKAAKINIPGWLERGEIWTY